MHKKEMKHDKNYLKLQWVYQCFKNVSWLTLYNVLSTYRFLSGNKCKNNINSMSKTKIKRYVLKRFY